jgi:HD superfamily phosphohydrolase YqeK
MWARYDCKTGEKEDLIKHLKEVGNNAQKIAKCLNDILKINMEEEAKIAGYFHDLFKVVYQPNNIEEFCKNREKLSFKYHEIASATFLSNYAVKINLNLEEEKIRRAVKAVLFHHQGLRAITLENFIIGYNYVMDVIKRRNNVIDQINSVLKELGFQTINSVSEFLDFRTLEGMLTKGNIYDRLLSGILMVADNLSVLKSLSKNPKRLLELEIVDYIKAIDCETMQ